MTDRLLALHDVHVHYRRGLNAMRVLVDVSLNISVGEVVAVWGDRGRGKSTLLRVAAGIQRPTAGTVLIGGSDLWSLGNAQRLQLSKRIAWVEAIAPGRDLRMLDHMATPLRETCGDRESYARATAALERVGVPECAAWRWGDLSDRERALVALAAALARTPRLLVVDDLALTLDALDAEELRRLIRGIADETGVGVLLGASELAATLGYDRFHYLSSGRLLAPA